MKHPTALALLVGLAACGRVTPLEEVDGGSTGDASSDSVPREARCIDLPLTCGPAGTSSCCDSKTVPGGMFLRAFDQDPVDHNDQSYPAQVSTFRLDTYEVTVGRFRQFVAAGYGTQAKPPFAGAGGRRLGGVNGRGGWESAWNSNLVADEAALRGSLRCSLSYTTWTDEPGQNEALPIVCATWYEAMAFCIWDGGYLPTEAQSMYAMAGGTEQRAYPWSKPASSVTVSCAHANFGGSSWPTTACNAKGATRVGAKSPTGDGAFGQADLGGNAMEWGLDWSALLTVPCNDCANLTPGSSPGGDRILRGGSYQANATGMRGASSFNGLPPTFRDSDVGFRCARPVN